MSEKETNADESALFYTFVLKLTDRPGAMESIAATFAHRGISLSSTLGNDGTLDPEGRAIVLVTFTATPARKEALRNALRRLSRVVSLVEHSADAATIRKSALVRLAPNAPAPTLPPDTPGSVDLLDCEADGCCLFAVFGPPVAVDKLLNAARQAGHLRGVTYALVAL
ncbi:MAG: hypothetical protein V4671_14685 [Armatimonadota bacterium]